jgi:hypothetical protein
METTNPSDQQFGCAICFPADAATASQNAGKLQETARLVAESHLGISIRACPQCGQRFIHVFAEKIDWEGGDDPQCISLLPITEKENEQLIAMGENLSPASIESLARERKLLRLDFPKDRRRHVSFETGGPVIGPHD